MQPWLYSVNTFSWPLWLTTIKAWGPQSWQLRLNYSRSLAALFFLPFYHFLSPIHIFSPSQPYTSKIWILVHLNYDDTLFYYTKHCSLHACLVKMSGKIATHQQPQLETFFFLKQYHPFLCNKFTCMTTLCYLMIMMTPTWLLQEKVLHP